MTDSIPETDPRERALGIAWPADKTRQIRHAIKALENWDWAIQYRSDVGEERLAQFHSEAMAKLEPLVTPGWEYGTRWALSEEAHGPNTFVEYAEQSEEAAKQVIRTDQEASGSPKPRGKLVRRRPVGPWEEVEFHG